MLIGFTHLFDQSVETQVEVLFVAPQIDFMETDVAEIPAKSRLVHLRKYGRLLHGCVERILLLLLRRAKRFMQEPENRLAGSVDRYCKAVVDTLDHSELEGQVRSVVSFSFH